jgi:hypothetical protein
VFSPRMDAGAVWGSADVAQASIIKVCSMNNAAPAVFDLGQSGNTTCKQDLETVALEVSPWGEALAYALNEAARGGAELGMAA